MRKIFYGTVMSFDRQHDRLSGRIKYNHGNEIFFLFADGRAIELRDNKLLFSDRKIEAYPSMGDDIVFECDFDEKKMHKAAPWGYEDCHWRDKLRLSSKPKLPIDWKKKPRRKRLGPK